MPSLLLEIFSEEIPARMQSGAGLNLAKALEDELKAVGIEIKSPSIFVTPRRLAVVLDNLPAQQADVTTEKKGPRTNAPQPAIDGFLKSTGLTLDTLEKRMVGKDETYFAVIHQKGQPTAAILKTIIEKILASFPWPKSMRWGNGDTTWVRPMHSILCLFDNTFVSVEFAGIKAGNVTYGHRFLAPQAITIKSADDYLPALKKAHVIASAEERKAEILKQAEAAVAQHNLSIKRDDGLLAEVTGLVEWPTVLVGSIDAKFMDLPPEVLTSEMRAHQKYFALLSKSGQLTPHFLIVSNMVTKDGGKAVIAGNERVLRARLSDGRFFYDQDRKKPLSEWGKGLNGVTFHAKVGTLGEKVKRIGILSAAIADFVPGADKKFVSQAAALCKADLLTGMVGEFPELQGVMGRYYALHQKEDAAVADAIRDHYLPLGPESRVPTAPVSICIALTDKLDTLISLFAAGEKPTGSKDPFALRRAALGIIRIILENNIRLPLKRMLTDELLAFFGDRLAVQLKDQGIRHDIIKAVMAGGDDDLVRVVARAKAVQDFIGTDDGKNLLAGYKRATNILSIEEKKDKKRYQQVDNTLFTAAEEKSLDQAFSHARKPLADNMAAEKFTLAMQELTKLRAPIDSFFDKVMVNCEDKQLRATRLGLLNAIRDTVNQIADFSLIEG